MTSHFVRGSIPSRYISLSKQCFALLTILLFLLAQVVFVLQPMQTNAHSADSTQDPKEPRQLEISKTVEQELVGGQIHSYQITLNIGQHLGVIVEQRGIDVVLWLFAPDGKQIAILDNEIRSIGQEEVELVAEASGNHRLVVRTKQVSSSTGRYRIQVGEPREATENDRALHKARQLTVEFYKLDGEGKFNEAASAAEQALGIREKVLGPDHPDVAAALNHLAIAHAKNRAIAKAAPLFERALTIREKSLGPEHPHVATSLSNLANIYQARGDLVKTEQFNQRALDIREKSLGPDHVDVAASLNNLANLYSFAGQYSKAEPLHQRALFIREKSFAPDSREIAESLSNIAALYLRSSDYAKAEPAFQRASTIWEKILGPKHPDVLEYLGNLAVFYGSRGDFAKAEPLHQSTLAAKEEVFGKEDPRVAASLTNLALFYCDTGNHTKALPLFQRALTIKEKTLGTDHPDVANALNNLAIPYDHAGDDVQAEPLHQRALKIYEKSLGPEHPNVAMTLNNLATLYRNKGDYTQAESFYKRSVEMVEKSLGPTHPNLTDPLNSLAKLYEAKGELEQSIAFQTRALTVSEHNLTRNLTIGSERQKLAYLTMLSEESNRVISLHARSAPGNMAARNLAFTLILQRKGCILDALAESLAALRRRANPQDRELLDQLKDTNSQLAKLVYDGPQKTTPTVHQRQIKTLEEQVEKLEMAISRRSAEFRAQAQPVSIAAVQLALPTDTALIEFAAYRPFNAKSLKPEEQFGAPRYVAYVLRQQGEVHCIELGETEAIDQSIEELRQTLKRLDKNGAPTISERKAKQLARALDEKVMQPVRKLLGDARQLLLSPDGDLNLVPFAALVDENNHYLVDRYSINYLTSGRDLLRLQVARKSKSNPLVVGDPAYGEPAVKNTVAERAGRSEESPLAKIYFRPLATGAEAEAIKAEMPEALVLKKKEATEAALKQTRAPQVLHIATHGFFLQSVDSSPTNSRGFSLLGLPATRSGTGSEAAIGKIENPLLRSGLALAGANSRQSGDDDGILTALEVAGLDLWGTKLVVLSACDTGIGEVKNGEGVYGLRRALILAGAESQVASLWKVNDSATKDLMIAYYKELMKGMGRAEALRRVQKRMLLDPKRRHPYYWASFIHSGEWANLDGRR